MPRSRENVPADDHVLDVLMRDLVAHDQQPSAFLVYLFLFWSRGAAALAAGGDEFADDRGENGSVQSKEQKVSVLEFRQILGN